MTTAKINEVWGLKADRIVQPRTISTLYYLAQSPLFSGLTQWAITRGFVLLGSQLQHRIWPFLPAWEACNIIIFLLRDFNLVDFVCLSLVCSMSSLVLEIGLQRLVFNLTLVFNTIHRLSLVEFYFGMFKSQFPE